MVKLIQWLTTHSLRKLGSNGCLTLLRPIEMALCVQLSARERKSGTAAEMAESDPEPTFGRDYPELGPQVSPHSRSTITTNDCSWHFSDLLGACDFLPSAGRALTRRGVSWVNARLPQ